MKPSIREAFLFFLSFASFPFFSSGGACLCGEKPEKGPGVVPLKMVSLDDYPWIPTESRYLSLQSGKAVWDFGLAGGRVTFLSKGRKVYIDRNKNGKVDGPDGDPLEEETVLEGRVPFRGGSARYAVGLTLMGSMPPYILIEGKSALAGRWGKTLFVFLDRNLDGRFFQFGVDAFVAAPVGKQGEKGRFRSSVSALPLSHVAVVEGKLYLLDCGEGGEDLKLYPYRGKTALLQVEGWKQTVAVVDLSIGDSRRDLYFDVRGPGSYLLPRGIYRIRGVGARFAIRPFRPGGKKSSDNPYLRKPRPWSFSLYGLSTERQPSLDLSGEKAVLHAGPPLRLGFDAMAWGKEGNRLEISNVFLATPGGIEFRAEIFGKDDTQTIKAYVRAGGKKRFLSELEYG